MGASAGGAARVPAARPPRPAPAWAPRARRRHGRATAIAFAALRVFFALTPPSSSPSSSSWPSSRLAAPALQHAAEPALTASPTDAAMAATAARLVHEAGHRRLHAVDDVLGRSVVVVHHGSHQSDGHEAAAEGSAALSDLFLLMSTYWGFRLSVPLLYVGAAASARVSAEWPLWQVSAVSAPLLYGLGQSAPQI